MYDVDKELRRAVGQKVSSREPVPADKKRKIRERAKNTCEYRGCKHKENLEFHHVNMRNNDQRISNIKLLCPNHHRKRHSEKRRKVVSYNLVTGEKKTRLVKKTPQKKTKKKRKTTRSKKSRSSLMPEIKMPKLPKIKF